MILRRYERSYERLAVDLVGMSASGRFDQVGSLLDHSRGGFRIQTARSLTHGQRLQVFFPKDCRPAVNCRVVWAHTRGAALPSDAGLQIEDGPLSNGRADSSDFLAELRGVCHHLPRSA